MTDYRLCGWRLRSDRPLPLLAPFPDAMAQPDIELVHRALPPHGKPPLFESPFLSIYPDGEARLKLGASLAIHVSQGSRIVVDAPEATPRAEVMTFLLGPILGLLAHQRAILPLHAATLMIGGKAVLVAGMSGAGKSTCAMALVKRGHSLLGDDIAMIDSDALAVWPSYPAIKLWQDAATALGVETEGLEKTRAGLMKFHCPAPAHVEQQAAALSCIVILNQRPHLAAPQMRTLGKVEALAHLSKHVYRRRLAKIMGVEQACLTGLGRLISSAPVHWLDRPDGFAAFEATVDRIESAALAI